MISVIMPIYNGEDYIENSVNKILNQPYKDIELILINDGSTDKTDMICKNYAIADKRVKYICKQNEGICKTRNLGLRIASGEYVSFIDQDDEINDNIFESLYNGFDVDIDLVVGGKVMKLIDDIGNVIEEKVYEYDCCIASGEEILFRLMNLNRDMSLLHIWNCLYKKDIIDKYGIRFDDTFKFGHEDSLFNIEYVSRCTKIRYISAVVYNYYRRKNKSTSLKKNTGYVNDYSHYINRASQALSNRLCNETLTDIFFVYCLRLGVALYSQYSSKADKELCRKNLNSIRNALTACCGYISPKRVTSRTINGMPLMFYIKLSAYLMEVQDYRLFMTVIKIKERMVS